MAFLLYLTRQFIARSIGTRRYLKEGAREMKASQALIGSEVAWLPLSPRSQMSSSSLRLGESSLLIDSHD